MTTKRKVGVLLESDPSNYSRALKTQFQREARTHHVEVGFIGVPWATESERAAAHTVEQTLELSQGFDAIILCSAVFSDAVKKLSRFAQHWAPRPIASIGYRLPGVPSVLVDNLSSVRQATAHLIELHGRRKLLFLRGRRDSQEAEQRYLGFRRALRDNDILHDDKRVLQADFTRAGTLRAFAELDHEIDYDGIVAANDDMALTAFSELQRRGRRVPEDVAVIGFDDIREAALALVPLSSMAQPFQDLARKALMSITQQLAGREAAQVVSVGVELVARRSCGCGPRR